MRTCMRGWFRIVVASALLLLGAAGASLAEGEEDSTVYARTVQNFLATVDKAKTIQFEMTISTRRRDGAPTMPEVRRYRVSISRPDRLAVVPLTPETAQFGMATDGEELLCYTPYSRQYCVVDAPETLHGIYEIVFKAAVRDLELDLVLQPFIENPYSWQNREPCQVREGEPMGEIEYAGVPCQIFFGRGTAAYFEKDKRALYRGRQETGQGWRQSASGQMVPGEIAGVTIDKWTLDGAISASDFSVKPPAGYERVKDLKALPPEPDVTRRTAAAGPADLPANASPAVVRRRAWTLFTTGYDNNPIAGQLFQRAADLGDPLAVMWVARLQQQGRAGFPADPAAAEKLARTVAPEVKRLAETGNPEAQFLWGMACVTGPGTTANPSEGLRLILEAANKGDTLAMSNAGTLLRTGQAGSMDAVKGFQWMEKAARLGNYLAIGNLALLYHWGMGVEPDRGKALAWHMKALCLGLDRTADIALLMRCEKPHPFTADAIRKMPYVKLFGTRLDDLPKVVVATGIVPADAPGSNPWPTPAYKKNGIAFVPRFDQVWIVELYAQGVNGFDQFAGQLPLGLSWDDTRGSVADKLGRPDNLGEENGGIWMGYDIDDLTLGVFVSREAPGRIQLVKIMARWAPQPQAKKPPTASAK